jgi:hypothetical protein
MRERPKHCPLHGLRYQIRINRSVPSKTRYFFCERCASPEGRRLATRLSKRFYDQRKNMEAQRLREGVRWGSTLNF